MRFLGHRAIPGVESFDGRTFRRAIRTPDDRAFVIGLTPDPTGNHVVLDTNEVIGINRQTRADTTRPPTPRARHQGHRV
jgi:hypothetical protein